MRSGLARKRQRWIEREGKLLKIILMPSIGVVWVLGMLLAFSIGAWEQGWLHAKLALVLGAHRLSRLLCKGYAGKLARGIAAADRQTAAGCSTKCPAWPWR